MGQFTVYKNRNAATRSRYPFLLDVQHDLLSQLSTCVVIPLAERTEAQQPMSHLNAVVKIENREHILVTQQLAGISRAELGSRVADLSEYRNDFISALDFLVSGI